MESADATLDELCCAAVGEAGSAAGAEAMIRRFAVLAYQKLGAAVLISEHVKTLARTSGSLDEEAGQVPGVRSVRNILEKQNEETSEDLVESDAGAAKVDLDGSLLGRESEPHVTDALLAALGQQPYIIDHSPLKITSPSPDLDPERPKREKNPSTTAPPTSNTEALSDHQSLTRDVVRIASSTSQGVEAPRKRAGPGRTRVGKKARETVDTPPAGVVCKFYLAGRCKFGDSCKNLHTGLQTKAKGK